ncbi:hypothetical protein RB195_000412 [Necator americanus]|uniref:Uncharacterized protein n=1 Tax=Necator americanus TaxID=51031 RepID=A0ABR1D9M0_NECAM
MLSQLRVYCIGLLVFHSVLSDFTLLTFDHATPDLYVAKVCGSHPLSSVLEKIGTKLVSQREVVRMLAKIRANYPKLWRGYQTALTKYTNCKLMQGAGTLG